MINFPRGLPDAFHNWVRPWFSSLQSALAGMVFVVYAPPFFFRVDFPFGFSFLFFLL